MGNLFFQAFLLLAGCCLAFGHWNYEQQGADWDGVCAEGTRQSPVDIALADVRPKGPGDFVRYNFDAEMAKMTIVNDGHCIKVTPENHHFMFLGPDWRKFEAAQYHFHAPSEHTFDGVQRDLELHVVHVAADESGALAVIGISFQADEEAPEVQILKDLIAVLPDEGEEFIHDCTALGPSCLDYKFLFPLSFGRVKLVTYEGSLTTPGCDESVQWFVQVDAVLAPPAQLDVFKDALRFNNTLGNYRLVEKSKNPGLRLSKVDFGLVTGRVVEPREPLMRKVLIWLSSFLPFASRNQLRVSEEI